MILTVRPEAEADIEEASRWYEERRIGLGSKFLDEVVQTFVSIAENPRRFPCVHRDIRRALMRAFPFGVFYATAPNQIMVVAVMHAHRDPTRWKERAV